MCFALDFQNRMSSLACAPKDKIFSGTRVRGRRGLWLWGLPLWTLHGAGAQPGRTYRSPYGTILRSPCGCFFRSSGDQNSEMLLPNVRLLPDLEHAPLSLRDPLC